MDPRISIGIDNCFAIKRWVTPAEWCRVIREMGLKYVECVANLEIEPLLTPKECHDEWVDQVREQGAKHGVEVVMMYSNNSTYDTVGFAHPDERVRRRYVEQWFGEFLRIAGALGAAVGYYVQGLPEEILYDKSRYGQAVRHYTECMERVSALAGLHGVDTVALEQMYTPHQPPFTIAGMKELLGSMNRKNQVPLYLTEDVGHHCPYYLRPTEERLQKAFPRYCRDGYLSVWLGSKRAQELYERERAAGCGFLRQEAVREILEDVEENGHLFSDLRDTDCYEWIRKLGAYSPVIHLQQTNGCHSSHEAFSPETNKEGIVHPVKLLRALKECYDRPEDPTLPPRCEHIYLIQELYLSTKEIGYQGLHRLSWSTDYLRRFIPRDGMRLSELIAYNKTSIIEGDDDDVA
ncbi:MAG: hypothetical protein HFI29_08610 [Lachnospiraceae bacterium]|jgi:sugar phosphate isomerase/epimerase|nr:hypothetical protein [Lachnospiraceae bacterium]